MLKSPLLVSERRLSVDCHYGTSRRLELLYDKRHPSLPTSERETKGRCQNPDRSQTDLLNVLKYVRLNPTLALSLLRDQAPSCSAQCFVVWPIRRRESPDLFKTASRVATTLWKLLAAPLSCVNLIALRLHRRPRSKMVNTWA